jgi:hypothetical protein
MEFEINTDYELSSGEGSSQHVTNNKYITLHETTNAGAKANASFFKNNWSTSQTYVQIVIGDGGKIFQVGADGYVAWGAGTEANQNSPVQIELARTNDRETFEKDYAVFVNFAREKAREYGIPCILDESGNGIKTHYWFTQNYWGTHTDPVMSYLLPAWGITQEKLAHDIAHGVNKLDNTRSPDASIPDVARDVVTVKCKTEAGIVSWTESGKIIKGSDTTFKDQTSWKTNGIKIINELPMYQVATNVYIPKKYTDQAGIVTINAIAGVTAINAEGEPYVGSDSTTFKDLTTWISDDDNCKTIAGRLCFQVSTEQFIDAFYTIGGGNK